MPKQISMPTFLMDELHRIEDEARKNLEEMAQERLRLSRDLNDAALDTIRNHLS